MHDRAAAVVTLSDRERELLPLLAGILSQREIGAVLNTVKTHSRLLYRKRAPPPASKQYSELG
ncbi:MAG: hypothetical protein DLM61_15280 [Pseudonocardiales bacterium]|nr:MAG: hypothetical protein DLM61_15280 [Pseudonocardiales bacterium]